MKTRAVSIDELRPNPDNPKAHAVAGIRTSIRRFGLGAPFVVDDRTGLLAAGHGRLEALLEARAAGEAPPAGAEGWVVPVVGWRSKNDEEARAFLVASNRLTEVGGWIAPALEAILSQLGEARLDGVGFDVHDLATVRAAADLARASAPVTIPPRMLTCPACTRTFPVER